MGTWLIRICDSFCDCMVEKGIGQFQEHWKSTIDQTLASKKLQQVLPMFKAHMFCLNPLGVFIPSSSHSFSLVCVFTAYVNVQALTFFGALECLTVCLVHHPNEVFWNTLSTSHWSARLIVDTAEKQVQWVSVEVILKCCNWRNKHHPHGQAANLWCFQKSVFFSGITIFSRLRLCLTSLKNENVQFKVVLRRYLNIQSFCCIDEFVMLQEDP